ncbi:hypothetical protein D9615_001530 [Tricholomella constricta]|uniref:Uncharacterized protein n=1 Tax=Tricholomella constricta TaxID=117010 RepID=A0A8H5HP94_9AGAR|nr:hypothetical protein D9615_001530 [Tricholomella constricta]
MAATAVAQAPKVLVHPPASPFAELLRRSKFATYDPAIRQTYSAAPANAHRGDWGLKRPIALRRKNAFISLTSFEHAAHFTEWNHAENQVRFIRRIEEMGVKPETMVGTPWHKSLGKAKTDLLLDSEFCPGESSEITVNQEDATAKPTMVNFNSLGNKGPGAYGAQRAEPRKAKKWDNMEVFVTANVDAMSKRDFERYLARLRNLRPAFQEHINRQPRVTTKNLYALAQDAERGYHRRFMMEHMTGEYKDVKARKIEPQPHPNAGLTYARLTPLEAVLWTKPQPGIVLNAHVDQGSAAEKKYVASFGGLGALLRQKNMASGKVPLLDIGTEQGVDQTRIAESIADMRVLPRKGLQLQVPPRVVGNRPQGLKGVMILAEVMTDLGAINFKQDNPHPLGSQAYIAQEPATNKSTPRSFMTPKPLRILEQPIPLQRGGDPKKLIGTLQNIITNNPKRNVSEEEL